MNDFVTVTEDDSIKMFKIVSPPQCHYVTKIRTEGEERKRRKRTKDQYGMAPY